MKIFFRIKNSLGLLLAGAVFFSACNKLEVAPTPADQPSGSGTSTLAQLLDDPNFSILKAGVTRAGLLPALSNNASRFTVFAPDNNAITASVAVVAPGVNPLDYIEDSLSIAQVTSLIMYHVLPQSITSASISSAFPNIGYPNILNPTTGTPRFNPLVRLSLYPSKRGTALWVNNMPITTSDIVATNGTIHKIAAVLLPPDPSVPALWNRIDTDTSLSFLKAAIIRADSGTNFVPGTLDQGVLRSVLNEFGPDLTVFAPTNAAFRAVLFATARPLVYQQLYAGAYSVAIGQGATPAMADAAATAYAAANVDATATALTSSPTIFQNPALFGIFTAQTVKGIVVSHVIGKRAYSVNLPTTATNIPTLLNAVIPTHPGVNVTATFTGSFTSAITVKGLGNATAANVLLSPFPSPFGTVDQNYINGVLHKIDQVLFPQ